jgi:hypothetical protein
MFPESQCMVILQDSPVRVTKTGVPVAVQAAAVQAAVVQAAAVPVVVRVAAVPAAAAVIRNMLLPLLRLARWVLKLRLLPITGILLRVMMLRQTEIWQVYGVILRQVRPEILQRISLTITVFTILR